MVYIPDNLDAFDEHEREQERLNRIHKRQEFEEEIEIEELPFYERRDLMDITMCCAKNCTHSNKCYRYRKEPSDNQEYYDFTYECIMSSNYDMFISMLETEIVKENVYGDRT